MSEPRPEIPAESPVAGEAGPEARFTDAQFDAVVNDHLRDSEARVLGMLARTNREYSAQQPEIPSTEPVAGAGLEVTPVAESVVPAVGVSGEAVHDRGGIVPQVGTKGQIRKEPRKREKKPDKGKKPGLATSASSTTSVSGAAPAQSSGPSPKEQSVIAEREPIILGRYRDHEGFLCDVRCEDGVYSYVILEGPDKGTALTPSAAASMRALMGNEWEKVDDTTEPAKEVPVSVASLVAEASAPAQPPVTSEAPPANLVVPDPLDINLDDLEPLPEILASGESKYFLLPALGKVVLLTRKMNRYAFADVKGGDETELDDELRLRDMMVAAHWREITPEQAQKIGNGWDEKTAVEDEKYREIFSGDIWVMRDEAGKFINAYRVGTIFPKEDGKKRVNVEYLDEKLSPSGTFESFEDVEKARMMDMDLENLRFILAHGKYERHAQGQRSESAKAPERKKPESRFVHIDKLGDEAVYVRHQDDIVLDGPATIRVKRVEKKEGGKMLQGYMVEDNASLKHFAPFFVLYDDIADLAAREGWVPEEFADTVSMEASAQMPDFFEGEMTEVQKLRIKADEARLRFVTTDYTQSKVWNKIMGVLHLRDTTRDDLDTRAAKEEYERAVMALQEAELAELKKEKLTPAELRERMAGMLHFYKLEERIELYKDRTIVAAEQKSWPGKVLGVFQKIGIAYNKLPAKVRLAAAVATFAGAGVLAFTGAAGAAAGALALRRAIASLGAGAGLDELAKQGAEYLRKRSVNKEQEEESEEIRKLLTPVHLPSATDWEILEEQPLDRELSFAKMKEFLEKDTKALDQKFQSQKREQFWRKTLVWGTAIGASSFFTYKSAFAFGGGQGSSDDELLRRFLERATASSTEHGASAPASSASAASAAEGVSPAASAPVTSGSPATAFDHPDALSQAGHAAAQPLAETIPAAKIDLLRQSYDVTGANGKAGLWGILKERLPGDFPKEGQNRAIQSLENAIRLKLDAMSPAERAAVGFHGTLENGKVNLDLIRPGDKILFEKLLTPDQIKTALEGKSISLPSAAESVGKGVSKLDTELVGKGFSTHDVLAQQAEQSAAPRPVMGVTEPYEDASRGAVGKSLVGVPDPYEDAPARKVISSATMGQEGRVLVAEKLQAVSFNSPRTIAQFLAENPDRVGPFKSVLGDVRKSIFLTRPLLDYNAATAPYDYLTHRNMGMVNMFRVQETFAQLHNGTLQEYAYNKAGFPLHSSQVESLMRVVATAQDPRMLGVAGLPLREESIDQYTRRIAALVVARGNEQQFALALRGGIRI